MHVSVQHIHIPTVCITYKEPTLNLYLIGAECVVCSAWCIFQFRKPVKKQKTYVYLNLESCIVTHGMNAYCKNTFSDNLVMNSIKNHTKSYKLIKFRNT